MADVPVPVTDRVVQFPTRLKLTDVATGAVLGTFDAARQPGMVASAGSVVGKKLLEDIQRAVTAYADQIGEESVAQSNAATNDQVSALRGETQEQIASVRGETQTHIGNMLLHPRIAYGRYESASGGGSVSVSLGFKPKVVLVSAEPRRAGYQQKFDSEIYNGQVTYFINIALAVEEYPGYTATTRLNENGSPDSRTGTAVSITDTGFTVAAGYNDPGLANDGGNYLAFG